MSNRGHDVSRFKTGVGNKRGFIHIWQKNGVIYGKSQLMVV